MKPRLTFVFLALLSAASTCAAPLKGRVQTIKFQSQVYGDKRTMYVYTPPGYPNGGPYPVVYATDGWQYWKHGQLPEVMETLHVQGKMPAAMAVMVDPGAYESSRFREYTENPALVTFLRREVVGYADAHYRTRRDRTARTILGSSLGGLSAVYAAWKAPDLFANAFAQSGSFWWGSGDALSLVKNTKVPVMRVALTAGRNESLYASVKVMADALQAAGIPHTFIVTNGRHNMASWHAALPAGLTWLFDTRAR